MDHPQTFSEFRLQAHSAKKRIILNAAIKVFSEKALQKASLREIAENAGISHAAIYRYFRDKQELFLEAFLFKARELTSLLESRVQVSTTDKSNLQITAETLIDFLRENEHYFAMMTQFMLQGSIAEEARQQLDLTMKGLMDRIESAIQADGHRGQTRFLAHTFFSSLNGLLISYYNYPGRSREEVDQHIKILKSILVQIFQDGFRAGNCLDCIPQEEERQDPP